MKTITTVAKCVCGLLMIAALPLLSGGNDTPKTIPAKLEWIVTTNWQDTPFQSRTLMGWIGDKDPNVTTYFETGTIQSNLVAYVEWKGKVSGIIVETIHIGTTTRSYIIKTNRVYQ